MFLSFLETSSHDFVVVLRFEKNFHVPTCASFFLLLYFSLLTLFPLIAHLIIAFPAWVAVFVLYEMPALTKFYDQWVFYWRKHYTINIFLWVLEDCLADGWRGVLSLSCFVPSFLVSIYTFSHPFSFSQDVITHFEQSWDDRSLLTRYTNFLTHSK